jgi:hypothetical protein
MAQLLEPNEVVCKQAQFVRKAFEFEKTNFFALKWLLAKSLAAVARLSVIQRAIEKDARFPQRKFCGYERFSDGPKQGMENRIVRRRNGPL